MLTIMLLSISTTALANNQEKINLVKKVYQHSIKCFNSDYGCSTTPVWVHADRSLKAAMSHASEHQYLADTTGDPEHPCVNGDFAHHALLGWAQDSPHGGFKISHFQFSVLKNGNVRATQKKINQGFPGFSVDIKLTRSNNTYEISDIYFGGDSLCHLTIVCHITGQFVRSLIKIAFFGVRTVELDLKS